MYTSSYTWEVPYSLSRPQPAVCLWGGEYFVLFEILTPSLCNSYWLSVSSTFPGIKKWTTTPSLRGFLPLFDLQACVYPLGSIFFSVFLETSFETFTFVMRPQLTLPGVFEICLPALLISKRKEIFLSWNFLLFTISVSCTGRFLVLIIELYFREALCFLLSNADVMPVLRASSCLLLLPNRDCLGKELDCLLGAEGGWESYFPDCLSSC